MLASDLFDAVLTKLQTEPQTTTFLEAAQLVSEVLTNRLWMNKSELLLSDVEGSVAEDENTVTLAATILGMKQHEHPWIIYEGQRYDLDPLPSRLKDTPAIATADRPRYYTLRGLTIQVYPATDTAITVKLEAYARPAAITSMASTIPFNGLFDQVFIDAVSRFGASGLALNVTPAMEAFLYRNVDMISHSRPSKDIYFLYLA